jgi:hypothetical protein
MPNICDQVEGQGAFELQKRAALSLRKKCATVSWQTFTDVTTSMQGKEKRKRMWKFEEAFELQEGIVVLPKTTAL